MMPNEVVYLAGNGDRMKQSHFRLPSLFPYASTPLEERAEEEEDRD